MKQKIIETGTHEILVVELPEGKIHGFKVTERGNLTFFKYDEFKGSFPIFHPLPKGNWQLLGRLPDITEEQADKVVDEYTYNTGEIDGCYDYENDTQTDCPIESLNSLMYTNDVYFEYDTYDCSNYFCEGGKIDVGCGEFMSCGVCEEAQSKVWNKEQTYIFIKVD